MLTDKVAIIEQGGRNISYSELLHFCSDFVTRIEGRELILVRCHICAEAIMAYVAAIKAHIPVMLAGDDIESKNIIDQYMPEYIWQDSKEKVQVGYEIVWRYEKYVLLKLCNHIDYSIDDELALLLSTSGSTGSQKYVRISYSNLETSTQAIIASLNISKRDIAMVMLPLSYVYGLSVINTYLYAGATLLVPNVPIIHKDFWSFFIENDGTAMFGVPYTYEVLRRVNIFKKNLSNLKLVAVAGGKMSEELEEYMIAMSSKHNFDMAVMYGQTEATGRISSYYVNKNIDKKGSAGKAIPNVELKVHDGELICCGDTVVMGYATGYKDLSKGDLFQKELYTGDEGYIDRDGYVYIRGRRKRIAKINGYRISLDELENIIGTKSQVNVACVEKKEKIYIIMEHNEKKIDCENMLILVSDTVNMHKSCFVLLEIKELPRNASGKIMYEEIKCE